MQPAIAFLVEFELASAGASTLTFSKRIMKRIILLFFAISALTQFLAASEGMKIEVQAYLKEAEQGRELWVSTLLINQTEGEKKVLIKPPSTTLVRDAKGLVLQIGFTGKRKANGYELIPSILPFEPVVLRKGEATRIMSTVKNSKTLESITEGEDIRIKYVVLESWGERFELWHEANETTTQIKTM
jgi:hypothetical protein